MKVALLDARQGERDPKNSSTVAYRNMLALASEFGADLYVSAGQLRNSRDDYTAIICGFGSTSTERDFSTDFLIKNKNARLFWMVGDYEQSTFAPLFYCKRRFDVIKNYQHNMKNKMVNGQHFINLNAILAGRPTKPDAGRAWKYGPIYYGRWRDGRAGYFKKYLQQGSYLSTSPKNMKKFSYIGCNPSYARAMSWSLGRETLRLFASSIYLEDIFTHTHYNCPANRYYESINCQSIILAQPESEFTFKTYGLELDSFRYVDSSSEVIEKTNMIMADKALRNKLLDEQYVMAQIAYKEREIVIDSIREIISGKPL
jgi:hypothetical protein